mgnify:CR=1 FL=1
MLDARAVADDDGRTIIGFSFADGFEGLVRVGAHGHLGNINVAIAHGHHAQVLLRCRFTTGREFSDRTGTGCLGGLTARVGVDFRIKDKNVDVFAGSKDVVQAAVTDIVGPAVTAKGPDALLATNSLFSRIMTASGSVTPSSAARRSSLTLRDRSCCPHP